MTGTANHSHPAPSRRGLILLVVLCLLALFAIIGIAFVLYAESQATAARLAREAEQPSCSDVDPELLLAYFMHQLVYGTSDSNGIDRNPYSALRGQDLMRNMFGGRITPPNGNVGPWGTNLTPYNGTGRLHTSGATCLNPWGIDDFDLVNYQYFPADGFRRDPEVYKGGLYAGWNPPYTYPDLNNLFLAAARADGTVLTPSFHRPWHFGTLKPSNPNWRSPQGKYLTLRPRPADQGPGFPYPVDEGGDVKNLPPDSPGYWDGQRYHYNDSIWIDLGFPVMTSADGRRFKPLFAPLILDLDNRVNLSVHGNIRGPGRTHVSNQGWGPWEVNLGRVLNQAGGEWTNLFLGNPRYPQQPAGRYGKDRQPGQAGSLAPDGLTVTTTPAGPPLRPYLHFYNQVDYDGNATARLQLPAPGNGQRVPLFPTFPAGYDNCNTAELTNHPSAYSPIVPVGDDRPALSWSNLEALLRYSDTGSPALTSDLFRLCPRSFTDRRARNLVTLHSYDFLFSGLSPYLYTGDPLSPRYAPVQLQGLYPVGNPIPFPTPQLAPQPKVFRREFGNYEWRTYNWHIRVNLNTPFPAYPAPDPTGRITDLVGFQAATNARQLCAQEIYWRLTRFTGAIDLSTVPPNPEDDPGVAAGFQASRWLAQLAVNIVDYLDDDHHIDPATGAVIGNDYMTAYNWYTPPSSDKKEWVYGTELPRVVVNEAYVEYVNSPGDPGLAPSVPPDRRKATRFQGRVWVELLDPRHTDPSLADSGTVRLGMPAADGGPAYNVYRLVLTKPNQDLRQPKNVTGDPDDSAPRRAGRPHLQYPPQVDAHRPGAAGCRSAGDPAIGRRGRRAERRKPGLLLARPRGRPCQAPPPAIPGRPERPWEATR